MVFLLLTGVDACVLAVEVELREAGAEASLAVLLFMSTKSDFTTGGCDMTTGCGAGGVDVFIIGLICVDPTFIVGAVDCCIALLTAAAFNIFAIRFEEVTRQLDRFDGNHLRCNCDYRTIQLSLTILLYRVRTIFRDRMPNLNSSWS